MSLIAWLQLIATIILIATLYVYHRQLRTMEAQLVASQNSASAQNLLALMSMLQEEDTRAARTYLLMSTKHKEYNAWNEDDRKAAAKVCATYGPAGAILKTGLVPREPIISNWGPSIRDCYKVIKPFIEEMQQSDKGGPDYMINVVWLYEQVKASNSIST
jgi:hypothetical protein